jgi:dienelactone hydrolase
MGGALTILSLTMVPEADAGVVWYGCRRWSMSTPRRSRRR